jgi:glycosyltransferase involved in cell wall biosynthesis
MRIAVFTDSFLPYICGATFAALNQVNALARRGHEVRIYCPGSTHDRPHTSETPELHERVTLQTVPFSLPWGGQPNLNVVLPVMWPTVRDLRRFKPDLVHVHTEWGTGWAGLFSAWRLKIPTVGTFHTFWDDPRYVHHFPWPNWKIIQRAMGAYSAGFYRRCDVTIAPSPSVQRHLQTRGLESVIVSNGMPSVPPVDAAEVAALRQSHGIGDEPVLFYLGRVSYEKSLPLVLHAFKRVLATESRAKFVLIGDGPEMPTIRALARELEIENSMVMTGAVDHADLIAQGLPRLGDVFVTASETENQPVSILEGMAFGLPTIGPRSRGIPELVVDEENGLLFDPGDLDQLAAHMTRMVTCPGDCQRLAAGALATAGQHVIERTGERLEALYTACVRDPATARASMGEVDDSTAPESCR